MPAGYKQEPNAFVVGDGLGGQMAFTVEEDAVVNDGKIYVLDEDAY